MRNMNLMLKAMSIGIALFALAGCSELDVVAKYATSSFDSMTRLASVSHNDSGWTIVSPGGERFSIADDFSVGTSDLAFSFDASPFIEAGLDVAKLPSDYVFDSGSNTITLSFDADSKPSAGEPSGSILDSFRRLVASNRSMIGYHMQADHYGISLGNGNVFEWARAMSSNDKDIVFALNPGPLIASGLDPVKTKKWVFTKVNVMDENRKNVLVEKLVMSYNFK
jgi:hypothetical protein